MRIERVCHFDARAQAGSAVGHAVVLQKTTPLWTNEMAAPQTDTHAREQTRRDEQAHKNGDAARAGVEKLADFRQRATEDAWKSMESSVDAASQGFQNASDQFARTLGFSGEEGERLARQSGQNVEAITKFGTVLTQACQDTSREWYGLAQKQLQRNLEGLSKLAHCRSVQDFAAVQSGLIRESLQSHGRGHPLDRGDLAPSGERRPQGRRGDGSRERCPGAPGRRLRFA